MASTNKENAAKLQQENQRLQRRVAELESKLQAATVSDASADPTGSGYSSVTTEINQFVLDHLNEAVMTIDSRANLVNFNQTACDMLQLDADELNRKNLCEFLDCDSVQPFESFFQELRNEQTRSVESLIKTRRGDDLPTELLFVFFESEGIELACVLIRDRSDEKQFERAFHKSENALRAVLNAVPDLMYRLNREGDFLDFIVANHGDNNAFPGNTVGSNLRDVLTSTPLKRSMKAIRQSIETGKVNVFEYELGIDDGEVHKFEARVAPISSSEVLTIVRDITDRKLAEKVRDDLIRRLEQKNAELERFTYTVSHDLKSPIITIKGFLELLGADLMDAQLSEDQLENFNEHIGEISNAADKMKRLLDQLLELSRIGRATNRIEKVTFSVLVKEALGIVHGQISERAVKVTVQEETPVVWCDRTQMIEVLQNLISNSAKFMGSQESPLVEIGCRQGDEGTVFFVSDNGIGIDTHLHNRVFALFERFERSQPGTGIGLAIVHRIVEIHGGRIWVESEGRGHGTTFCFTLEEPGPLLGHK